MTASATAKRYKWPTLILLLQLVVAASCVYWHYQFQSLAMKRAPYPSQLQAQLRNVDCASLDKAAIVKLMESTVEAPSSTSNIFLVFAYIAGLTSVFTFFAIIDIKRSHAATING